LFVYISTGHEFLKFADDILLHLVSHFFDAVFCSFLPRANHLICNLLILLYINNF